MSEAKIPKKLGDYELIDIIDQVDHWCIFSAVQLSIKREVILVLLHPEFASEEQVSSFRDNVRAKASVRQVNIGQIFEIKEVEGYHFFTRQKISGEPIQKRIEQERSLTPSEVFRILQSVAEASIYLEERKIESRPLELKHIFLNTEGVCHLKNTALAGQRDPQRSNLDLRSLGEQLKPLVDNDASGAGRAHTLLQWMRGENRDEPITWSEILNLCKRIDGQFTSQSASVKDGRPKNLSTWLPSIIGVVVIAIVLIFGVKLTNDPLPPKLSDISKQQFIEVQDPETQDLKFAIQTSPVSIRDYSLFLDEIEVISSDELKKIQHPEQPASKTSFEPTDWQAMQNTASAGGEWEGKILSLDSPVTFVDFWDSWAYAKFHSAQLASESQWQETLNYCRQMNLDSPLETKIREWTSTSSRKPSFPMGPKYPKLVSQTEVNVKYDFAENRSLRSSDLSFRLLTPAE